MSGSRTHSGKGQLLHKQMSTCTRNALLLSSRTQAVSTRSSRQGRRAAQWLHEDPVGTSDTIMAQVPEAAFQLWSASDSSLKPGAGLQGHVACDSQPASSRPRLIPTETPQSSVYPTRTASAGHVLGHTAGPSEIGPLAARTGPPPLRRPGLTCCGITLVQQEAHKETHRTSQGQHGPQLWVLRGCSGPSEQQTRPVSTRLTPPHTHQG